MGDFVETADPWFRPVCFAFSPDGSLYIGDFYNRIIGHYEVPLNHPGRDRERGRIWRVVLKSLKGQAAPDLTKASAEELVSSLAHPNISARMLAMDQLTDRIGKDAAGAVRKALRADSARLRANALWVLYRLGEASEDEVSAAAFDSDALVRGHAIRLLAEKPSITVAERAFLMTKVVLDEDALVRRCAADALGRHTAVTNLPPLLNALRSAPAEDTHLVHTLRMALRDNLQGDGVIESLSPEKMRKEDAAAVTGVLVGIGTPAAAELLLRQLEAGAVAPPGIAAAVKPVCRFGGGVGADGAGEYVKKRFSADPDQQVALLKEMHEGAAARGGTLSETVREFAGQVAMRVLSEPAKDAGARGRRVERVARWK
jgi:HEAT repeat protein